MAKTQKNPFTIKRNSKQSENSFEVEVSVGSQHEADVAKRREVIKQLQETFIKERGEQTARSFQSH